VNVNRRQPEIKFEVNKEQKVLFTEDETELKMLQKSAEEKLSDSNDFFLEYGEMSDSILK
jgi:hypothetical protein